MARHGLRIYPNEGGPSQEYWQFTSEDNPALAELNGRPYQLADVSGASWSDTITFNLPRHLWFNVKSWWQGVFTSGVTQRRLASGEVLLVPQKYPCSICRVCWDVMDKRTGERFVETATGLVVLSQVEVEYWQESWQITLHRGDYYLNDSGILEASTRGCGG